MIAHSTMSKDLYPKTWAFLFDPGTLGDWVAGRKFSPRAESAMWKVGALTPADLQHLLWQGEGPTLRVLSGREYDGRWKFALDEIAISYRSLKSYEMGIMP